MVLIAVSFLIDVTMLCSIDYWTTAKVQKPSNREEE
jgi:hypothetical protein